MQIVYVLCAKKEAVAEFCLKLRQCNVRGIRLCIRALLSPFGIELPHQRRVPLQCIRRANILNPMPCPKAHPTRETSATRSPRAPVNTNTRSVGEIRIVDIIVLALCSQPSALSFILDFWQIELSVMPHT